MGRFSVRTFVRLSVPPLWASGLAGWASGLAGWPRGGTDGRMDERTDGWTYVRTYVGKISLFYRTLSPIGAAAEKARMDGWADGRRENLHTIWPVVEQRCLKNEDVFTVCNHAPIFYLRLAKQCLDVRAQRLEPVSCSPGVITQGLEVGARGLGLKGRFCGSEAVARRLGLGGWGS